MSATITKCCHSFEVLDDARAEIFRRMTPTERVTLVFEANRTVRQRLEFHVRSVHPKWDTQMVMREVARRMLHNVDLEQFLDKDGLVRR
jgi:hypothetical protein